MDVLSPDNFEHSVEAVDRIELRSADSYSPCPARSSVGCGHDRRDGAWALNQSRIAFIRIRSPTRGSHTPPHQTKTPPQSPPLPKVRRQTEQPAYPLQTLLGRSQPDWRGARHPQGPASQGLPPPQKGEGGIKSVLISREDCAPTGFWSVPRRGKREEPVSVVTARNSNVKPASSL